MAINPQVMGLAIGFVGGLMRGIIGFCYKKAKNPKIKFRPWKFSVTLFEGAVGGIILGSLVTVTDIKTGVALALAAAGLSEIAGKTGLHDALGLKP